MVISFEILGDAGNDNAALVRIDSGKKVTRLLFDCGEGCLSTLATSEVMAIDHVFFSHFHMDHIGGFDSFFRVTYDRATKPNIIWGPPSAIEVIQHRFQGYIWNLRHRLYSQWYVNAICPDRIESARFAASEAFANAYPVETKPFSGVVLDTPDFSVEAYQMDHMTPSMGYIVREKSRTNVDPDKLSALGLAPGSWLKQIKEPGIGDTLTIDGKSYNVSDLRHELLTETPGQSVAYLTDFQMDDLTQQRLVAALSGCTYMICESQYLHVDLEYAQRNYHMTATQVAQTASKASVGELILFHISDRYERSEWFQLLEEAKAIFPNTRFSTRWFAQG